MGHLEPVRADREVAVVDGSGGAGGVFAARAGRAVAMPRLLELDGRGELTAAHVRLVAQALGRSERTVWRWLAAAREDGRLAHKEAARFTVTEEVRQLLAFYGGNASRVHAELVERAQKDPVALPAPSLSTLHRAIRRDLSRGERAGLKNGEAGRRAHDVFGKRPPTHRNAVWEGDHKHLPVEVDLEGEMSRPWVTWFIDCATKAVVGVAVTAHAPSRDAVLACLRTAISRSEPFGPFGGLPGMLRVDRGKEFLCQTVTHALGAFAVPVRPLPAYTPHLKGTVEALNDAVEEMFLVTLPRYTRRPDTGAEGGRSSGGEAPLAFEAFVQLLLDWVNWWNTVHRPAALGGRPPLQAWREDPTPIDDVPEQALAGFGLEDDGRTYTITSGGVRWRRRDYLAPWMVGHTGTPVIVRHLPHHDDTIEVFDTAGRHLGAAYLAEKASKEQMNAVRAARQAAARRTRADARAAARLRRTRFEAVTTARTPNPLDTPTAGQADAELAAAADANRRSLARPDYVPHGEAPSTWVRPLRGNPPASDTPEQKDRDDNR